MYISLRTDWRCGNNFDCMNGVCIPQSSVCDGSEDCLNGVDERSSSCTGLVLKYNAFESNSLRRKEPSSSPECNVLLEPIITNLETSAIYGFPEENGSATREESLEGTNVYRKLKDSKHFTLDPPSALNWWLNETLCRSVGEKCFSCRGKGWGIDNGYHRQRDECVKWSWETMN